MPIINEVPKQESWFRAQVEFENSFKFWFALMWQNIFLPIFVFALIVSAIELYYAGSIMNAIRTNFVQDGCAGRIFTIAAAWTIPAILPIVGYFGFYKYWQDIKPKN